MPTKPSIKGISILACAITVMMVVALLNLSTVLLKGIPERLAGVEGANPAGIGDMVLKTVILPVALFILIDLLHSVWLISRHKTNLVLRTHLRKWPILFLAYFALWSVALFTALVIQARLLTEVKELKDLLGPAMSCFAFIQIPPLAKAGFIWVKYFQN